MRAFLIIWTTFAMAVIVASARADQEPDNVIPVDFEAALEHAEEAYLVSIDRPKESRGFELPKLDENGTLAAPCASSFEQGTLFRNGAVGFIVWLDASASRRDCIRSQKPESQRNQRKETHQARTLRGPQSKNGVCKLNPDKRCQHASDHNQNAKDTEKNRKA